MHIICLTPLEEGVYNDHKADHITIPSEGWAMIPEDMVLPATFPRLGSLEAKEITYPYEVEVEKDGEMVTEQRERVIMTVTVMSEGTSPEPEPGPEPEPDVWAEMAAAIAEGVNDIE
jgi:hypothetical protein